MAECFRCGISDQKAYLMNAITKEGIQKICRKCSFEEDVPLIKEASPKKLEESEKPQSVYERMQRVSGVHERNMRERFIQEHNLKTAREDENLRALVEKNYKSKVRESVAHDDLVENFHWIVMRARRLQKITIDQLAGKINEPVSAVKLAEQGFLSNNYSGLIKKLEGFLNIRLFKRASAPETRERKIHVVDEEILGKPDIVFEKANSGNLTIDDLRRMKQKHEEKIFQEPLQNEKFNLKDDFAFNERVMDNEDDYEFVDSETPQPPKKETDERDSLKDAAQKRDLTKKEMDRILFGKK